MKLMVDYSDDELLELTPEQVDRLIDIECADAGVPLLPPFPHPPSKDDVKSDVVSFRVQETYFMNESDARQVADLASKFERIEPTYVPGPRYDKVAKRSYDQVVPTRFDLFSTEHWDDVKSAAERFHTEKTQYDKDKLEYDRAVTARSTIASNVHQHINKLLEHKHNVDKMWLLFERYISLADGDRRVAAKFLAQAHSNAADLLPELKELLEGQDIKPAAPAVQEDKIPF